MFFCKRFLEVPQFRVPTTPQNNPRQQLFTGSSHGAGGAGPVTLILKTEGRSVATIVVTVIFAFLHVLESYDPGFQIKGMDYT